MAMKATTYVSDPYIWFEIVVSNTPMASQELSRGQKGLTRAPRSLRGYNKGLGDESRVRLRAGRG